MENRIITLDSLIAFCRAHKTFSFSAKEVGHPLVVSTLGEMSYSPANDDSLLQTVLKSCHTGLNRNGSFIADEDMTRALPSFANKPILAEIKKNSKGELDFGTHAMEFVEDENGSVKIHYIEQPVGIIPESHNGHLEYDEQYDKNFAVVNGYIFKYYGNETAEILERKGGTKVSVELEINEMSWDSKENYLVIKDFTFSGVTLLSEDVGEGMLGSRLDISDFSQYQSVDYSKEINEMKSRLASLESRFSDNQNSKEGGNQTLGKLDELLAQYGKTVDDIDFDYEGMSDEELEAKFAEVFGTDDDDPSSEGDNEDGQTKKEPENDDSNEGESGEDTSTTDEFDDDSTPTTDDDPQGISNAQKTEDDEEGSGKKLNNDFALSLQEKINALDNLVNATYGEADNDWYFTLVYDEYVVMCGYFSGRAYKQSYKGENDEYSLVGDRVEVYVQYLTQEEMDALENMKKEYAALSQYKADIEKMQLDSVRDELLNDERFLMIKDTDAYKELVEKASDYSVEDLETSLKLIVADNVLGNADFSKFSKQKSGRMFTIPSKSANTVTSKYGGIFTEKK